MSQWGLRSGGVFNKLFLARKVSKVRKSEKSFGVDPEFVEVWFVFVLPRSR